MSIGITEIVLILVVVLVLFGGKRIPELAKALGRASYEYKRAKEALKDEVNGLEKTSDVKEEKPKRVSQKTKKKSTAKKSKKTAK